MLASQQVGRHRAGLALQLCINVCGVKASFLGPFLEVPYCACADRSKNLYFENTPRPIETISLLYLGIHLKKTAENKVCTRLARGMDMLMTRHTAKDVSDKNIVLRKEMCSAYIYWVKLEGTPSGMCLNLEGLAV
ncbi:hypothetical protein F4678DRAFT_418582 [Xylaria arbuscula]|nr:hypothetical protein F4678DRAFT_418582 [Xylaria arbuscula]